MLAEGEFYRVGGQTPVKVDVRVIAATHQDLETRVKSGHFREDLLHRLNVIRIEIPPLRERREDIPELLRHYLAVAGQELGRRAEIADGACRNRARDLRLAGQCAPARQCLPPPYRHRAGPRDSRRGHSARSRRRAGRVRRPITIGWPSSRTGPSRNWTAGTQRLLDKAVPEVERILIRVALRKADGLKQDAAKLLGWGRNTLTRKMKELGMEDVS